MPLLVKLPFSLAAVAVILEAPVELVTVGATGVGKKPQPVSKQIRVVKVVKPVPAVLGKVKEAKVMPDLYLIAPPVVVW